MNSWQLFYANVCIRRLNHDVTPDTFKTECTWAATQLIQRAWYTIAFISSGHLGFIKALTMARRWVQFVGKNTG